VNPGVARIVIVVALVVGGVSVLANGFGDEAASEPPRPTSTASPTESPTPTQAPRETASPTQDGVLVQVLNGTNEAGMAGDFQILLDNEGYLQAGEPADAPDKPVIDSIVYFRRDAGAQQRAQNRADAGLLAKTYLDGATVEALPEAYQGVVSESANVVVVLGEDQV
jgi:LytR cell envelope-related transcriptional attenuator